MEKHSREYTLLIERNLYKQQAEYYREQLYERRIRHRTLTVVLSVIIVLLVCVIFSGVQA